MLREAADVMITGRRIVLLSLIPIAVVAIRFLSKQPHRPVHAEVLFAGYTNINDELWLHFSVTNGTSQTMMYNTKAAPLMKGPTRNVIRSGQAQSFSVWLDSPVTNQSWKLSLRCDQQIQPFSWRSLKRYGLQPGKDWFINWWKNKPQDLSFSGRGDYGIESPNIWLIPGSLTSQPKALLEFPK